MTCKKLKTVLSVAGSDSSGGAGIQADIKTMMAHGVYGMTAITALTAQNTVGVRAISEVTRNFLADQLDAVFEDIVPDAVKIGMIPSAELIKTAAERLKFHGAKNIVADPVMVATSGSRLMRHEATEVLKRELLPLAALATPNIPEAEVLSEIEIRCPADMEKAAKIIFEICGCPILLKGGHNADTADDLLYDGTELTWFRAERLDTQNTHGTGCTLSSAVAANLAKGKPLRDAINLAKTYVFDALSDGLDLGHGGGPLNHAFALRGKYFDN